MRTASFLLIAIALFAVLNAIALRHLLTIHPRRHRIVIALAILGNAMWPFLVMLNAKTDFSRLIRATLGPPWFAWLAFVLFDSIFIALVSVMWALAGRRRPFREFAR